MNTIASIDDVFANYPDEWILLDELETDDTQNVLGGKVVGHDPLRSAVEAMAIEMRLERCVMVCTKKRDGEYVVGREYAVSPITSAEEIEKFAASAA